MTNEERDTLLHDLDKKIDSIISSLPNFTTKLECVIMNNCLEKKISKIYVCVGTLLAIPAVSFGIYRIVTLFKG